MSNFYPVWWDKTITIYNQYKDPVTKVVFWYRTELSNCFWKRVGSKVQIGNTILDSSSLVVRIPKNSDYLDFDEWLNLPKDSMPYYFTIQLGDIIVLGSCEDEIHEGISGERSTDFLNTYKGKCLVVKEYSIDTFTGLDIPHYRILGE